MTAEREALVEARRDFEAIAAQGFSEVDAREAIAKIDAAISTTRVDDDAEWLRTRIAPHLVGDERERLEGIANRLALSPDA